MKNGLRLKAMQSMMSEKPEKEYTKRPIPGQEQQDEDGQDGMESMMVTEEEKQLILSMRAEKKGKPPGQGDDEEDMG